MMAKNTTDPFRFTEEHCKLLSGRCMSGYTSCTHILTENRGGFALWFPQFS